MKESKNLDQNIEEGNKSEIEVVDVLVEEQAKPNSSARTNKFLAISILVAALLICGTLLYVFNPMRSNSNVTGQPTSAAATASTTTITIPNFATSLPYPQTREGNEVVLGNPKAPVQIVEYGDYQCTFCNLYFNQTEPLIRQDYVASGKVSEVFKNLVVIDNFVPGGHESADAALAASCAMDQNKFWEYHDAIYTFKTANPGENAGDLTRDIFTQIATKLGMNVGQFTSCFDSKKYSSLIASDMKEATSLFSQVATPSFVINGQTVQGAEPFSTFQTIIDAVLKKAGQ
ncbi:DsbA family protein [Patescibacteria group bacterium]|nr:DsbA family protein [Patescibacteria group bacterium]